MEAVRLSGQKSFAMLGKTFDGFVVIDRDDSHVQSHKDVLGVLPEALAKISARGRNFIVEEVVFDRIVGKTICVPTGPGDEIVFAQRPNRFGLTRFVKNREAMDTKSVTIILKKAEDNKYILITAFIGPLAPAEPWDTRNFKRSGNFKKAQKESLEFWNTHALVWGVEETLPGTETTTCPW